MTGTYPALFGAVKGSFQALRPTGALKWLGSGTLGPWASEHGSAACPDAATWLDRVTSEVPQPRVLKGQKAPRGAPTAKS